MMRVQSPVTPEDFEKYYDLRWRILRKPWSQPRGSEKDELEAGSIHVLVKDGDRVVGIGRGHFNTPQEGQVRYMAVEEGCQGKGIGGLVLGELEQRLKEGCATYVVLNSRDTAIPFYEKHGYHVIGDAPTMFGVIQHVKMRKDL